MAGTWPSAPRPQAAEIISVSPSLVSVAHSLTRQARSWDAQQFGFRLTYPQMERATFAPFFAMAVAQRGRYGSFTLPANLVGYGTPLGIATGTPVVAGTPAAGERTITSSGWTASQTGILKAGDLIKTTASAKVYMVTDDCNSDGSGLASISIEPSLRAALTNGTALTVSAVPFTAALTEDSVRLLLSRPFLGGFTVEMLEVF